ncbi:type I toxin-antitoxin system SymE family toxin [Salmonella enterica]|nr:type I toxin-antitoxin system SymE family toxin [Salmonella enterica]
MKIGYISIRHLYHHNYTTIWFSHSPSLRLNGNWMAEAGFSTDTPVIVSVAQG